MMLPHCTVTFHETLLAGQGVVSSQKTIGQLAGVFENEAARRSIPPQTLAYEVKAHLPVKEGTAGGLFFGISYLNAGDVGGECFMTRGHFHACRDRGEYYWGLAGHGLLLLMSESGETQAVSVCPGSLHYIPGHTAHRLVNTGAQQLIVGACWPSDAGHDYAAIESRGFGIRVFRKPSGEIELRQV